mmetsp:Transcript_34884/g.81564  ORF Transcript_34884/g.81564 Transcript_34884/m.81564 type:complete len:777 (-) Transcript_34884:61-2391(-)
MVRTALAVRFLFLVLSLSRCSSSLSGEIDVKVEKDGSYQILIRGQKWFTSSATKLHEGGVEYSSADGSLRLESLKRDGARCSMMWKTASGTQLETSVDVHTSFAVFSQRFPQAVQNTSTGDRERLISAFPSLRPTFQRPKGVLSYRGDMTGNDVTTGTWDTKSSAEAHGTGAKMPLIGGGIVGSGPVVVFEPNLDTSIVLSAFSNFMAHSQNFDEKANILAYGIMGGVTQVPEGFTISTVISVSEGISKAMDTWGDIMLGVYGARQRYEYKRDFAMQYLGYSTDNGAYYYYQTIPGMNYQSTMSEVVKRAKEDGIPYRYVLLDSWWYLQGENGGVKTWEPRADVFPDGMAGVQKAMQGWPQQLHNRMWATDNTYAKQNGGRYNFIMDGSHVTVPDDQMFWDDLMQNKTKTGMFMYEQDWLDTEFDQSYSLGANATLGRTWLMQIDRGAKKANVTIQLCMSHVRHVLQSVEMSQVTNTRSSADYQPGNDQWNIGTTSILAHALGLAPSKDNFWSNSTYYLDRYNKARELHPEIQSAVSSFSTGPVAPGDKVSAANVSIIVRCCDDSGRLLTPDRPAVELDRVLAMSAMGAWHKEDGHLWSTSVSLGSHNFRFLLAFFLQKGQTVSMSDLGLRPEAGKFAVLEDGSDRVVELSATEPLLAEQCVEGRGLRVFTISPISDAGYALLGERSKWVAVSGQRFASLVFTATGASVQVAMAKGEEVDVMWKTPQGTVTSKCSAAASSEQAEEGHYVAMIQDGVATCRPAHRHDEVPQPALMIL